MNSQETSQGQSLFIRDEPFGSVRGRRARSGLSTLLLALVVLLALPCASFAQSALTDDAQTSTAPKSTDSNFGANPNLSVSAAGNVYLKFKLSSTLPVGTTGSEVERATLKLYIANITTAGKLDVYAVAGAWDEATVSGRNAPPLGSLLTTTAQIDEDKRGKFLVIDITSLVQQWLGNDGLGTGGLPNNGLALVAHPLDATTAAVASITFDSKENSQTSHEAQLNVQLDLAADGLQKVEHDSSLTGDGTSASPLGVANGGINTVHLATDAVTGEKIADNAVTSSELADGAVTSPKITAPLSLTSADSNFTLSAANTGAGAAITANGAINTTTHYNIGGNRILSNPGTNNLFAGTDAGASNATGTANAFFGKNSGQANTSGASNSFVGYNAGAGNTTGGNNSFFGDAAGFINAAGNDNSFFGFLSGFHNTASNNAFFGSVAGADNTTGGNNSFFGGLAGIHNMTGASNSFFGGFAGQNNTAGSSNSFFGFVAGLNNQASSNSFFGRGAGFTNTIGSGNSFFGTNASDRNSTGGDNSSFGFNAGQNNTTGSINSFFGVAAGISNTNGSNLTVIGGGADVGANNLNFATAIGAGAVVSTSNTVVLGRNADTVQIPGGLNAGGAFGANIVNAATQYNIAGSRVLSVSGTQQFPNSNIAAGVAAGAVNSGSRNSFFGASAGLDNTTGSRNSIFGAVAGADNTTGDDNSFFGYAAGSRNTTGCCNSFFGQGVGFHNTTGAGNTFSGFASGSNNETGRLNSFFGNFAGGANTTGEGNSFFGDRAGFDNVTGNNLTSIGRFAAIGANNLTNATAVGAFSQVTQGNSLVLGSINGVNFATASTNVGIGTTAPKTKLHVTDGKVYVEANGQGVVLKALGGACFELTVSDAGALTTTAVACP
jgi:hypothetical protein